MGFPHDFVREHKPRTVPVRFHVPVEKSGGCHLEVAIRDLKFRCTKPRLGRSTLHPHAFTEHGAIMAAMVLNSPRATEVSVYVVRAFVELRDTLVAHKELAKRLDELESRLERELSTHDQAIAGILDAIRQLMVPPESAKKRRIGFVQND